MSEREEFEAWRAEQVAKTHRLMRYKLLDEWVFTAWLAGRRAGLTKGAEICSWNISMLESHTDESGNVTGPEFNFCEIVAVSYVKTDIERERDGK